MLLAIAQQTGERTGQDRNRKPTVGIPSAEHILVDAWSMADHAIPLIALGLTPPTMFVTREGFLVGRN